jgi:putative sterol carrier protein
MGDATAKFFDDLDARDHEPLLATVSGTLRFELTNGRGAKPWLVGVKRGDVTVSRQNADADCVVRADGKVFDGILTGNVNAMAAMLRGEVSVEGDPELMVSFQRLLPGPPGSQREARS